MPEVLVDHGKERPSPVTVILEIPRPGVALPHNAGVDCAQQVVNAGDVFVQVHKAHGGQTAVGNLRRRVCDVDSDSRDSELVAVCVPGGFDEDAPELSAARVEVVWPLEADLIGQAERFELLNNGKPADRCKAAIVFRRYIRPQDDREQEVAFGGVPFVSAASAARGLAPRGKAIAVLRTTFSCYEQVVVC